MALSRAMEPPLRPVPAPRGDYRYSRTGGEGHDGGDLFGGLREDDGVRGSAVDAGVVFVEHQVFGAVEHRVFAADFLQVPDD